MPADEVEPIGLRGTGGPRGPAGAFDLSSLNNMLNVRASGGPEGPPFGSSARRPPHSLLPHPAPLGRQDPSIREIAAQISADPAFRSMASGLTAGTAGRPSPSDPAAIMAGMQEAMAVRAGRGGGVGAG